MFGGVLTLVLLVVMRVLVVRQWRAGIGLNLKRRLLLPVIALLIGLWGVRLGAAAVFGTHLLLFFLGALVVTVVGGVVRTASVEYSTVPATDLYPGGIRIRARVVTLAFDVAALVVVAVLLLPTIGPVTGLHPAAASAILAVALGDIVASGLLVLRGRPATLEAAAR